MAGLASKTFRSSWSRFTLSAATWWVPLHLPFYFRIFHCNPSSYWESPLWKPPQSQTPTARG
jgi:hypothetical protein